MPSQAGSAVSVNGPARHRLPRRDPPALQARGRQLVLGLGQRELLQGVAASSRRLEHRSTGRERRAQRPRVGVIEMEVGEEPGEGPAGGGGHDPGKRRRRRLLAKRREHRARVLQRIDHHRRTARLHFRSGPAQPCQSHPSAPFV